MVDWGHHDRDARTRNAAAGLYGESAQKSAQARLNTVVSKSSGGGGGGGGGGGSLTQKSPTGSISQAQAQANAQKLVDALDNAQTSLVQPVYVSGGAGGNTYRVVNPDGTSYQFAASGISLADASKYYAEKAANTSDPAKAAEWMRAAGDFAAAANYEEVSGIRAKYGAGTGMTYDATASLDAIATPSGYRAFLWDTAEAYPAGQGLTDSSTVSTFGLMTVPRTLATTSALYPSSTSPETAIGNSLTENSPAAAGNANAFKIGVQDLLKQNDGSSYEGQDVLTGMGQMVDSFASLPETVAEGNGALGFAGGLALTCLLPTDLVKTVKKITDGKANEVTGWDIAYSLIDAISLIPVAAPLKLLKVAKAGAVIGGSLGLTGLDFALNGAGGEPSDGDGDKPSGKQDVKTPETPYSVTEKTTVITQQDNSGIMELLTSLFAAGGNQAGESGGSGGGGEVTVINNAAEPADYSGLFKYIIPGLVIIAGAFVLSKLLGKNSKKGAAA